VRLKAWPAESEDDAPPVKIKVELADDTQSTVGSAVILALFQQTQNQKRGGAADGASTWPAAEAGVRHPIGALGNVPVTPFTQHLQSAGPSQPPAQQQSLQARYWVSAFSCCRHQRHAVC
jgi:hypothetical protein